SWWVAVHGAEPPESEWIRMYRENVVGGLAGADTVVAPTKWMLDEARRHYGEPREKAVVYNGRDPRLFLAYETKEPVAISVGRLWDAASRRPCSYRAICHSKPFSSVQSKARREP